VTVVGRVHLRESRSDHPLVIDGQPQVRRIDPSRLTGVVPNRLYDAYVLLDEPAEPGFTPIPSDHENAGMNAGYVVQWWAFALITLGGFAWAARREVHLPPGLDPADSDRAQPDRARSDRAQVHPMEVEAVLPEAPVSPAI
jgi:cytochrome oxidase assembly protein ShyY1